MNKKNNPILTLQTIIIVCTAGLFSFPFYCQEAPAATTYTPRSRLSYATQKKARQAGILTQPQEEEMVELTEQEIPAKQDMQDTDENTESGKPVQPIKKTTKQANSVTAAPSTWTIIYNLLPQIFVQSFSTGSDAGIGAFTKMLTKQLLMRQQNLSEKIQLQDKLVMLSSKETKEMFLANDINTAIQQTDTKIKGIELRNSPTVILGTAASTAIIYTASAMMGALMKIGLTIAIQLMAPQTK